MFTRKAVSPLQTAIDNAVLELANHRITSDEYATIVNHLCKMQEIENKNSRRLDPNTMASVAANIAGILMIIHHEHVNVITSKALGFVKFR
ncbi:MAG TPA: hypothetical protein VM715_13910 [Candidatus Acidoferrum sp.]|jgi:hypothetical protein|nr:hypothetical protein [Candidatus Acidoferrum sp.]